MDVQGAASRSVNAMNRRAVAFRTDASLLIGSGHVMRCLALADALRAIGKECHFICRAHAGNLLDAIRSRGFAVHELPAEAPSDTAAMTQANWLGCDWSIDARQTGAILAELQPDWLVVDHYALDRRWEMTVRPESCRLMVIDDLADRPHDADLLLDQNLGRQPQDYDNLLAPTCAVLAGPRYALLRPEFAALREYSLARRHTPALQQLLISLGGVDKDNATGTVLAALQHCDLPTSCRLSVIMGAKAPWIDQVRGIAAQMPWPTEVLVNISDVAQRMANCDLAIGAAGSTAWERCCLGLPALMVVLAENQRPGARALEAAQAARLVGEQDDIARRLSAALQELMQGNNLAIMSQQASRITDGQGIARVMSMMGDDHA